MRVQNVKTPRRAAELSGANRYFTGKPCKRGHIVERRTHNGQCIACQHITDLRWKKPRIYIDLTPRPEIVV
jgi:hypothetical protein